MPRRETLPEIRRFVVIRPSGFYHRAHLWSGGLLEASDQNGEELLKKFFKDQIVVMKLVNSDRDPNGRYVEGSADRPLSLMSWELDERVRTGLWREIKLGYI